MNRAIQKPTNEVNEEEKFVKQLNFVAIVHICDVTTGTFPFTFWWIDVKKRFAMHNSDNDKHI